LLERRSKLSETSGYTAFSVSSRRPLLQQITPANHDALNFEFLAVGHASAFSVLSTAVHNVHGSLSCASSAGTAMEHIARRKVDAIVLDMHLPGAMDLLAHMHHAGSYKRAIVFACIGSPHEAIVALQAGANFVLQSPLNPWTVAESFKAATQKMVAERRRFFRYPLMLPVSLTFNAVPEQAIMANLSEDGMSIWNLVPHPAHSTLDFSFTLPFGGHIHGQGEIVWTDEDATSGIRFRVLPDQSYHHLFGWLTRRDHSVAHQRPA
jgi:CheY-like chemotaxis protein